jgi:hypothetical protein
MPPVSRDVLLDGWRPALREDWAAEQRTRTSTATGSLTKLLVASEGTLRMSQGTAAAATSDFDLTKLLMVRW